MATHRSQAQARQAQVSIPRRGEIYLVALDPAVGHEIQKTRPALVIQNDVSNRYSPITIVAAITSRFATPPHPREVVIELAESGLPQRSAVVTNQIRSVDRSRVTRRLGKLSAMSMQRVNDALRISLGLIDL